MNHEFTLHTPEFVERNRLTKGELVTLLYPDVFYNVDMALPQAWVDECHERGFDDAARHCVMVYPRAAAVDDGLVQNTVPFVGPVTTRGLEILARLASTV